MQIADASRCSLRGRQELLPGNTVSTPLPTRTKQLALESTQLPHVNLRRVAALGRRRPSSVQNSPSDAKCGTPILNSPAKSRTVVKIGKGRAAYVALAAVCPSETAGRWFMRHITSCATEDLKGAEFKPEYAGKMNFYLAAVDDTLKHTRINPASD